MTTDPATTSTITTVLCVLDPLSSVAVFAVVALVKCVTIVVVTSDVVTAEYVLTVEDALPVEYVLTVDNLLTVDAIFTVEGLSTVEDVTVDDILMVEYVTVEDVTVEEVTAELVNADVLTVLVGVVTLISHRMPVVKCGHTQVNLTCVDGLHVAPVLHGWSAHDFRRSQYQPAHEGSHIHSIPVPMPPRDLHVPPFLHGNMAQLLCIGHRNVSLNVCAPPCLIKLGFSAMDLAILPLRIV